MSIYKSLILKLNINSYNRIINDRQEAAYPEGGLVGLFLISSWGVPLKRTFAD